MVPSSMEGFGLPIVEGLVCGSRVVCSDIPAFREIGGGRAVIILTCMRNQILRRWLRPFAMHWQGQRGRRNGLKDSF